MRIDVASTAVLFLLGVLTLRTDSLPVYYAEDGEGNGVLLGPLLDMIEPPLVIKRMDNRFDFGANRDFTGRMIAYHLVGKALVNDPYGPGRR